MATTGRQRTEENFEFYVTQLNPTADIRPSKPPPSAKLWARIILAIEGATQVRWRITSHIRDAPSHTQGYAMDIAPTLHPDFEHEYSIHRRSDPILHRRPGVLRDLKSSLPKLSQLGKQYGFDIYLFLESDHIHVQTVPLLSGQGGAGLAVWGYPKTHVYPDSQERMVTNRLNSSNY